MLVGKLLGGGIRFKALTLSCALVRHNGWVSRKAQRCRLPVGALGPDVFYICFNPLAGNKLRELSFREMPVDTPPDDRIATCSNGTGGATDKTPTTSPQGPNSSSPKLRLKFHKFWGANSKFSRTTDDAAGLAGGVSASGNMVGVNCAEFTGDERQKRRGFAHYDVQSLTATVGLASKLQSMLSRRRNTATGASAASMLAARSSTPDSGDEDLGDGKHNNLLDRYKTYT